VNERKPFNLCRVVQGGQGVAYILLSTYFSSQYGITLHTLHQRVNNPAQTLHRPCTPCTRIKAFNAV
jgi:hypothetical protein